ncbi:MAG TPA: electron transport complex subunit RsxC [Arenimonas sp.]|uniref:electron transport complex subunit RsxC n=1 Tax=Arenimonas sp. TaxID=1872635 RepID=UPI002CF2470F|nr:electron transport complex subunit RsxC [Arenimonas sp.]HMB58118.1 electron transport complex subunit RsxC [Arenimonas sp.]
MSATAALRLHRFHGGLSLERNKSQASAIQPCPLPEVLHVPLLQHAGNAAMACVDVGDRVRCGQRIAIATGLGADVHAPADGTIIAIVAAIPDVPDHAQAPHVQLRCASEQGPPIRQPSLDPWNEDVAVLHARIRDAGLVGLGGAGFPTAEKISPRCDVLILNGAECEPYIACDDALLRERANEVVLGGRLLARLIGAQSILLAIEDAMPAALAACAAAISEIAANDIALVAVPTIYPEGGERQLIEVLTGKQVPRGGLPRDIGVLVQNVATAAAAWRAVSLGEMLTTRIVTVTGRGVARPGNFEVAFGTPISHLIAQAGGYTDLAARLLLGGPMMGNALPHDDIPLGKTDNCVLVLGSEDLRETGIEMPCIRCGDCADVCPAKLQPQQLLWHARSGDIDRSASDGVFDCIECGCCDLACPSQILLTQHFRETKTAIRIHQRRDAIAVAAGERHARRAQRLQRESDEKALRDAERAKTITSTDAVTAALERAKARRQQARDEQP